MFYTFTVIRYPFLGFLVVVFINCIFLVGGLVEFISGTLSNSQIILQTLALYFEGRDLRFSNEL